VRAYESLRRRNEFARLQRRGKRSVGDTLVLLAADGRRATKVGITVAKTVGNAVTRNRVKRRVKAILDRRLSSDPPYRELLFIARPGAGEAPFERIRSDVERLLGSGAPGR
jgi:ribonuclease P protein component